jgi:hypothetical protein
MRPSPCTPSLSENPPLHHCITLVLSSTILSLSPHLVHFFEIVPLVDQPLLGLLPEKLERPAGIPAPPSALPRTPASSARPPLPPARQPRLPGSPLPPLASQYRPAHRRGAPLLPPAKPVPARDRIAPWQRRSCSLRRNAVAYGTAMQSLIAVADCSSGAAISPERQRLIAPAMPLRVHQRATTQCTCTSNAGPCVG